MRSIRQPVMTNFCQGTCHDIFNRVSLLNHIFLSIRLEPMYCLKGSSSVLLRPILIRLMILGTEGRGASNDLDSSLPSI